MRPNEIGADMNQPASKEPTMDEILSSIRQIIADDDEAAAQKMPVAKASGPKPVPAPEPVPMPSAAEIDPFGDDDDDAVTPLALSPEQIVEPPAADEGHVDLHDMGAKFRAHWLGLLGFGAVILVIIFSGFMLRYGFSHSYTGRTNLLQLRYKHMRRGDQ